MKELMPIGRIENKIYVIRKQKVMLDRNLAELYGVKTFVLNQAVKRNLERFPADFMFSLTRQEILSISQFVISSGQAGAENLKYLFKELKHKVGRHDIEIGLIIKTIEKMIAVEKKPKRRIGFFPKYSLGRS